MVGPAIFISKNNEAIFMSGFQKTSHVTLLLRLLPLLPKLQWQVLLELSKGNKFDVCFCTNDGGNLFLPRQILPSQIKSSLAGSCPLYWDILIIILSIKDGRVSIFTCTERETASQCEYNTATTSLFFKPSVFTDRVFWRSIDYFFTLGLHFYR